MTIVLSPKTLAMAFHFLADIRCAPLLKRLYHEGGHKSAIAGRHVPDSVAAYMRDHCGIDVERRGKGGGGG